MRETARRLIQALNNIDEVYYLNEAKKKLSDAELAVMYALDDGMLHSQREISQEWLLAKTSVNTITKRWEKDGLLTLAPIEGKRREMSIILTDKGKEYAKGLAQNFIVPKAITSHRLCRYFTVYAEKKGAEGMETAIFPKWLVLYTVLWYNNYATHFEYGLIRGNTIGKNVFSPL